MAHCTKCGAAVADNAGFCAACGAPQSAPGGPPSAAPAASDMQPQMAENLAGLLCYVLGWVTGLVFYFIDKRPFVRFHAAQSIVVFGGLNIITYILAAFFGMSILTGGLGGFTLGLALFRLVDLLALVLWILLMIKAYQGERFRVPIAADLAEKFFGKA
jgi:uncharacterized membrane protein